jgi:hypothetical protein
MCRARYYTNDCVDVGITLTEHSKAVVTVTRLRSSIDNRHVVILIPGLKPENDRHLALSRTVVVGERGEIRHVAIYLRMESQTPDEAGAFVADSPRISASVSFASAST